MVTTKIDWAQWRMEKIADNCTRIAVEITGEAPANIHPHINAIRQYMAKEFLTGEVWNGGYTMMDDYTSDGIDEHFTPEDGLIIWDESEPTVIEASITDDYIVKIDTNGNIEDQLEDFYDEFFFQVGESFGGERW